MRHNNGTHTAIRMLQSCEVIGTGTTNGNIRIRATENVPFTYNATAYMHTIAVDNARRTEYATASSMLKFAVVHLF